MIKLKPALEQGQGRSLPWSGSTLVNAFAEKADSDKREDFAVMAIPGLDTFTTIPSGHISGLYAMNDTLYTIAGFGLFSVLEDGSYVNYPGFHTLTRTPMAGNGTQLALVGGFDGKTAHVLSGGVVTIPFTTKVSDVCFIDGYILWTAAGSGQFFISGLNDALTYDALDFATAEGDPDNIVGVLNSHREVLFFGKRTIEVWTNTGAANFPFERQGNAFIERGIFSRDAKAKADNTVFWLGENRSVYRLNGYSPVRVSTHAIEYRLKDITDAFAYSYMQEGHEFFVLNTDQGTFVYDVSTGAWHERRSYGLNRWRIWGAERIWDKVIMGDNTIGRLYTVNLDSTTEQGQPIQVEIGLPTIEAEDRQRKTMYAFELLSETGVGIAHGPGSDPQVALSYSDDGGRNWSNEVWRSLGKVGDYSRRAIWRTLGQFRQRSIKLRMTDPVRRFVISYYAEIR